jgi:broad specificity phosphatase PhoE
MTYEEIEEQFPEEFERREQDKLAYRYPRGESYLDVIARLEPIIMEMERHREPLLIVGHQGSAKYIYVHICIYIDVIVRLEPIIMEMERHREPLLTVGHQGSTKCNSKYYSTFFLS